MEFICIEFGNFLVVLNLGMVKIILKVSDSEDCDDLLELVDCMDDEVIVF